MVNLGVLVFVISKTKTPPLSRRHEGKNPYPARGKPILRFLWIDNQNYWPIGGIRHIFSVQLHTGSLWLFILFFKPQYWYACKFLVKRIVSTDMIGFGCFTDYSLWKIVIRLYIYFTDWFCGGVLVFIITKTKRGLCFLNYENWDPSIYR